MTTAIATIFVLGVLIFVHELGHFLVAKWAGIRVERFSLGFPPKMFGVTVGETEYCISWIPLGGYVKMTGEDMPSGEDESSEGAEQIDPEVLSDPRAFNNKSIGARTLVILAGPLMNFIAAIFVFVLIFAVWGNPVPDPDHVQVGGVMPGSPADKVGIRSGDTILAVDHQKVTTFEDMRKLIEERPGQMVEILWKREGDIYSAPVVPLTDTLQTLAGVDSAVVGKIGVGMGFKYETVGFVAAVSEGVKRTFSVTATMFNFLGGLISGGVSIKMVSGPVGIAQVAGSAAREGFDMLLSFMAILSVNLAILNILPIPVLDGGHLVFLLIEKIRRRPLTLKQRAIAQQVGLALLLLLIVTVTYNDILRAFSG